MFDEYKGCDKILYFLQGGGALGSYQVGVCERLLEHGLAPDWIIGTSIGAINAAILVGNKPEERMSKLKQFWDTITIHFPIIPEPKTEDFDVVRQWKNYLSAQWVTLFGNPNFFTPRGVSPWLSYNSTPDKISFYDVSEFRKTLQDFTNFDIINEKKVRLTLSAVCIEEGALTHFDNTHQEITIDHVLASCALPPAFPAITIDGKSYWDGGVSANTPFNIVLEEKLPNSILCIMVNLFPSSSKLPKSMIEILGRKKEIEYSSHYKEVISQLTNLHRLQHAIHVVCENSDICKVNPELKSVVEAAHPTRLNVVRFQYCSPAYDLWSKDFEFSEESLQEHYKAGLKDVEKALKDPSWLEPMPKDVGIQLKEF